MKRILTTITALLLAAITLAACAAPVELKRGTIDDNVYTNESAELTFTAPDGWKYATDEELAEMTESITKASNEQYTYDMYITDTVTDTYVAVIYQNLAEVPNGTDLNEEKFFDSIKEEFSDDTVYNYSFSDYKDAKIGSNAFKVMSKVNTDYGMMTDFYYVRRAGNYMLFIIVTYLYGDGDIRSVMANFS